MNPGKAIYLCILSLGCILLIEGGYLSPCSGGEGGNCNFEDSCCISFPKGCPNKLCVCKDGYSWDLAQQKCLCHIKVEDDCDPEKHICPVGSLCLEGKCKCPGDIFSDDCEQCGKKEGEVCLADKECNQRRGQMTCQEPSTDSDKKCRCAPGWEWNSDHSHCLPKENEISCTIDDKCRPTCPFSFTCINKKCKCLAEEFFDVDSSTCQPKNALVSIGEAEHCSHVAIGDEGPKVCAWGLTCTECYPSAYAHNKTEGYRCTVIPNINSSGRLEPYHMLMAFLGIAVFHLR